MNKEEEKMNSMEFFDLIKQEWCRSEEQWKPFFRDMITFARKYHKERLKFAKEHSEL